MMAGVAAIMGIPMTIMVVVASVTVSVSCQRYGHCGEEEKETNQKYEK
jgi:hypothetical protein